MSEALDIVAETSPVARTGEAAARTSSVTALPLDAEAVKQLLEAILRERLKATISEEVAAFVQQNEQRAREFSLLERIVRVEEELKALREVQMTQFAASEKRFEAIMRETSARFEAMDKRFEAVDKRFEAMDKRFAALQWMMGLGFTLTVAFMGFLKFF